jgi:hypothetical protein
MAEKDFHINEKYNFRHALSTVSQIRVLKVAGRRMIYTQPLKVVVYKSLYGANCEILQVKIC